MKTQTPWTPEEMKTLKSLKSKGTPDAEIAEALKRPLKSVTDKIYRESLASGEELTDVAAFWKKKAGELERDLREARRSQIAEDVLAEQVLEMAPRSYQPTDFNLRKVFKGDKHATGQSGVLLFSDTHIGAEVHKEQTLGLGNYNFEIFLRRLKRMERSVFSITQDHTNTPIPEIVVPILGDMLDGALTHSAECAQSNTILTQFYSGGHAIAQFLRNISVIAPLRIYGCVGNHPRWQNQHKMPTKNRNSNFDMLLYLYVQALTRDIPTIKWNLDWQPFATFEVQGFPFYCGHGDNLRGGDKALGIPAHSMGRMVSTTTQLFTRAAKDTPSYFCVGHLHRPITIPHAKGEIIVNGAFPGIDNYALSEYFNSAFPIQRFFFMHPRFGKSACYDLRLDLGDDTPHEYELPKTFPCA